jgi:hypothetical protein
VAGANNVVIEPIMLLFNAKNADNKHIRIKKRKKREGEN